MDIPVITFIIIVIVVGLLLTATIRRDFIRRSELRRDVQNQIAHLQQRRRSAERP